ncbi:MAG: VOC family protein [Gemmatimonadota bacterium]|nr:VOC family protein [Gemmatimonadota bacterium]MDE2985673.1 VOC family protein [Gemmatimonadota bacterium]
MSDKPLGRFSWHEIMTTDTDAARDFYPKITGWGTSMWDGGEMPYEMWMNGEMPVGGLMDLPAPDVPPCWLAYVSTPDLDATMAKVRDLGGSIMGEMAVPEVGRFAVIADPQGGVIAVIEPEGDAAGHDGPPELGEFSWHELATTDADAAWAFYSEVFGWEATARMDMGDMGFYQTFGGGRHPLGGIMNGPPGMPAPGWLLYVRVPDVHAAVETVKASGGQILNGPMEVPGGDTIAQCMDPQGIAFAVHATVGGEEDGA